MTSWSNVNSNISWSQLLPRDIRGYITSFLDQYDKYYPVINYKKYLIEYCAEKDDTDNELKCMTNLQILHCEWNEKFTDDGLKYLINLQELHCGWNKKFTDEGLKYLINLQTLYCGWNNNFTDEGLKYLINLKELHCNNNRNFTDKKLKYLKDRGVKVYS